MLTVTEIASCFHTHISRPNTVSPIKKKHSSLKKPQGIASKLSQSACAASIMCKQGKLHERSGIDRYEKINNCKVTLRDDTPVSIRLIVNGHSLTINGRPDGVCIEKGIVIEHKRRVRKLLNFVPYHEKVQCHLYMKMLNMREAHIVESFGQTTVFHSVPFDDSIWSSIIAKLVNVSCEANCRESMSFQIRDTLTRLPESHKSE